MSDDRKLDELNGGEDVLDAAAVETGDAPPTAENDTDKELESNLSEQIGAYVLGALPDRERGAFERYLAETPVARDEVRQLQPLASLLPALLAKPAVEAVEEPLPQPPASPAAPVVGPSGDEPKPAPPEKPARPAKPATAEPAPSRTRTIRTTPDPTGPFGVEQPRGRRRAGASGAAPRAGAAPLPLGAIAAGAAALIAVAAIIWALALQGRIETKDREIRAQAAQIAELRRNANATAYTLAAGEGAAEAIGTLLFSVRDQVGVLYVQNMPGLEEGRVYQVWYVNDESTSPSPGGTFRVDRNGNGMIAVDSDTPTFDAVIVTDEPQGGSDAPTSEVLLQGRLGGAAG